MPPRWKSLPDKEGVAPQPRGDTTELTRLLLSLAVVVVLFGFTFGIAASDAGVSWTQATVFSFLAYGGAGQFATISILSAGGSIAAIVLVCAVLGARFAPMSLVAANRMRVRGWRRPIGVLVLSDPSGMAVLNSEDPIVGRRTYWLAGATGLIGWTGGTAIGALLGDAVDIDLQTYGLDMALPALLVAISSSALKDRESLWHMALGGAAAVAATTVVPAGVDVLLGGAVAAILLARVISVPGVAKERGRPQ